jgi:thiosulfate/3-mercaptopyruvate sulfurtransferase
MTGKETKEQYLTSVEEMSGLLDKHDVVIIDTREPEEYINGHIPGALNIYDIFSYLVTKENGGYDAMCRIFAGLFGSAGICCNERVVVYEDAMDNGYGRSCRGLFILKYLGHANVTVLHGGFQRWLEAGLPLSDIVPVPAKKIFPVNLDHSIILTWEEVLVSLDDPEIILLDCRDRSEWIGISSSPYGPDFTPRKGRIPGSVWIEWYEVMKHDGTIPWFKEPEELREVFLKAGITTESKVYTYCFKGARTSNVYISMKLAGIKNVRNYFGSWNEWSRDISLPIEQGYPRNKKT